MHRGVLLWNDRQYWCQMKGICPQRRFSWKNQEFLGFFDGFSQDSCRTMWWGGRLGGSLKGQGCSRREQQQLGPERQPGCCSRNNQSMTAWIRHYTPDAQQQHNIISEEWVDICVLIDPRACSMALQCWLQSLSVTPLLMPWHCDSDHIIVKLKVISQTSEIGRDCIWFDHPPNHHQETILWAQTPEAR